MHTLRLGKHTLLPIALALFSLQLDAQITQGNLVVLRLGDGAAALTNSATAAFLDEFTPAGTLVQSIPLPTAVSGAHQPLTCSGTATSEGYLTYSTTGQYLVCAGYAAIPGSTAIGSSSSAAVQRVIGRIDLGGNIDTTTTLGTSAFTSVSIRSAASPDGVQFYATGGGTGVHYTVLGPNTSVQLNTLTPTNTRVANIWNGQLYVSSASSSFFGISSIGTGLPTTAGQSPALLNGFPFLTGPSSYDFFFADASTVYVADDRPLATGGGIQKWTESAGVWSLQYTLAVSATQGCRGLTGINNCGGGVTLFATTTSASVNSIVSVVDAGAGSLFTPIASAAVNTVFRGIRLVTVNGTVTPVGTGSLSSGGVPTIASSGGSPVVGNLAWGLSSTNWPAGTIGGLVITVGPMLPGIQIPGAQPGALLYANLPETLLFFAFADGLGNANQTVGVPCNNAFVGVQAGGQWIVLDGALPYPLQFATSPGALIVVGN